jgi:hypothetical protein
MTTYSKPTSNVGAHPSSMTIIYTSLQNNNKLTLWLRVAVSDEIEVILIPGTSTF